MKGQTATEFIFLAALIIVVAGIVYISYSAEATATIAETTIRTQTDLLLAKAAFINATCAGTRLQYINETSAGNYEVHLYPSRCEETLLDEDTRKNIQGRVSEALGCRFVSYGNCKGKVYELADPSTY